MKVAIGGPCAHCGRTSTPCWRKGPPEKPCLCNACGARWMVKHSLEGYMPGTKATGGSTAYMHVDNKQDTSALERTLRKRASSRDTAEYSRISPSKRSGGAFQEDAAPSLCWPEAAETVHSETGPILPLFKSSAPYGMQSDEDLVGELLQQTTQHLFAQPVNSTRRRRKQARPLACC